MKCCGRCKKEKPFIDFYKNKRRPDGYKDICKSCYGQKGKEYAAKWYQNNKDKHYGDCRKNYLDCTARLLPIKNRFLKKKSCHKCGQDNARLVPRVNGTHINLASSWTKEKYREKLKESKVICVQCIGRESWQKRCGEKNE